MYHTPWKLNLPLPFFFLSYEERVIIGIRKRKRKKGKEIVLHTKKTHLTVNMPIHVIHFISYHIKQIEHTMLATIQAESEEELK